MYYLIPTKSMQVRLQKRGRITLPKNVRKALGVREGDNLVLEVKGNTVMLKPKRFVKVSGLKGTLEVKVDLEEIEEAAGHL
jgi:AbrB family looped-hinge helix DNA binding protein